MIGCLRTRVRNQPIIALYFESENELKFYNLEATGISETMLILPQRDFDIAVEAILFLALFACLSELWEIFNLFTTLTILVGVCGLM